RASIQYMRGSVLVGFESPTVEEIGVFGTQERLGGRRDRDRKRHLVGGGRTGQQVALTKAYALFHQPGALRCVLDALGHERHTDTGGEERDRLDQVLVFRDRTDATREPRIDLQERDG